MINITQINFKKIRRISPSQFLSMKNCAYKSLLAEAFDRRPLLPVSPNAYLGTALHKVLELISKGVITDDASFNKSFDEQVKNIEHDLGTRGFGFLVPLQKNVKDFGLKKVLLKKHVTARAQQQGRQVGVKYHSEKWFESNDGLVGGQVDLIVESDDGVEIIDLKTGSITQDVLDDSGDTFVEVKEEYKDQLKIYAFLYFENTGIFPNKLTLMDLAKQKFGFDFSHEECKSVYNHAKQLLYDVNESINSKSFSANPNDANCKFCLYRPACSFYLEKLAGSSRFNDASGIVNNVIKYQNGNVSLFMETVGNKITIMGFPATEYNDLNNSVGKLVNVFNLRREATEFVYSWTKTTVVYG